MLYDLLKLLDKLNPIRSTDDAIGFFAGSAFTTMFIHAMDWNDVITFFGRAAGALVIGVIGGWAGLMGKDLYKFGICRRIQLLFKRKPKRK